MTPVLEEDFPLTMMFLQSSLEIILSLEEIFCFFESSMIFVEFK